MLFSCPKCLGELIRSGSSYVCPSAHSYDAARSGYVNLLPPSGASVHGDNREMVAARRDFLNTGHYLTLANRISELAVKHIRKGARVIDVGCGEGYYTEIIERALSDSGKDARFAAFDISKDAVRLAAGRCKNVTFAVASAYHVPASDGSFDAAINMFSPLAPEEMRRILNTGATFIIAFPAEEHLFGLKAAIYDTPYKNAPLPTELSGFRLLECERVRYEMELSTKEEIRALFMMTPYAYRTSAVGRERVLGLESLSTEADFYICVYEKVGE